MIFFFLIIAIGFFLVIYFKLPQILFLRRTKKHLEASLAAAKRNQDKAANKE